MESGNETFVIALSREEAQELFVRCLRSHEEDTIASAAAIRKLALLLESDVAKAA